MEQKENKILNMSFEVALEGIKLSKELNQHRHYAIANQLLRSSTSIGANVREAQYPESRRDFYHKMKIAAKETGETQYWLELIELSGIETVSNDFKKLVNDTHWIIMKILESTKKGMAKK